MRFFSIFPVLCIFISIILSFLCLFAGSKKGFMESYAIVTLNTSRIAVDLFDNNDPYNPHHDNPGFFGAIGHDISHEVHHLSNKAEGDIEGAVNHAFTSVAAAIGLHDFYSVHVLDFCEGFLEPNDNGTLVHHNVTHCSPTHGLFTFKPSQILRHELRQSGVDITLRDLHWPEAIDDAVQGLSIAFKILMVLYCIGIAITGLAFWTGAAAVVFSKRALLLANIFLTQSAFFTLLITSAIVTGAANKITDAVNEYGKDIDVNARRGDPLIRLTWTTTLLMFIASTVWMIELLVQRRKDKKMPKEYS